MTPARLNDLDPSAPDFALSICKLRQQLLAEFGKDALGHNDLATMLQRACIHVAHGLRSSHAKIMRYRPETADLLLVAGVNWKPGVVGQTVLRADIDSPPGRALQTGSSVCIEDIRKSTEFRYSHVLREHGIVSTLNVPISADGVSWGVLEVDHVEACHFTNDDADFLSAFASFLGAMIARVTLEEEACHRAAMQAVEASRRELMVRELHHRIKNNFQVITSMLMLQRRKMKDESGRRALSHVADRVTAIGLAHEQLSFTQATHDVKVGTYLKTLVARIEPEHDGLTLEVHAEEAEIPIDRAVAVGLIVNEAIANAVKHAFPEGNGGTIRVDFELDTNRTHGRLCVSDTGKGMGPPREGGSGMLLIKALASQISGKVKIQSTPGQGTKLTVRFALTA